MINGIIDFDQQLALYPRFSIVPQSSLSKNHLNKTFTFLTLYWVLMKIFQSCILTPSNINIFIDRCLFDLPFVIQITVMLITWFFMENLKCRFRTLNDILWKDFPAGLIAVPGGKWTHSEIAVTLENLRLLHVKLSELLDTFNSGFGLLLLGFFVFSCIDLLFLFFFNINSLPAAVNDTINVLKNISLYIIKSQHVICMMLVIVAASRIKDEVRYSIFITDILF